MSGEKDVDEDRRGVLKSLGLVGGLAGGAGGVFYGFISALHGASALSNLNYWQNEPLETAYEPAIRHAANEGELDIKTVHLDYDFSHTTENVDPDTYQQGLEEIMEELPRVDEVETSYDVLEPTEEEWLPDTLEEFTEYTFGGKQSGLYSVMEAAGQKEREEEYQLLNVITPSPKILEAGEVNPNIDGVAYIQDSQDVLRVMETSAHEDAHLLGVGHTLADGMTNVPVGQAYSAVTDEFFGSKSKGWWEDIVTEYQAQESTR